MVLLHSDRCRLVVGLENVPGQYLARQTLHPAAATLDAPARRLGSRGERSVLTVGDFFFGFDFVEGWRRAGAATMCCPARLVVSGLCMQPRVCMDVCLCLAVSGMPARGRAADGLVGGGGRWWCRGRVPVHSCDLT